MAIRLIDLASQNWSRLHLVRRGPWLFSPADAAITAMTDYRERAPQIVPVGRDLASALRDMRAGQLQPAFVVEPGSQSVVGLITAADCMCGLSRPEGSDSVTPTGDAYVGQRMWPLRDWTVIDLKSVQGTSLGEIYLLFKRIGIAHLPVLELSASEGPRIRGLFSATQVQRMLLPSQDERDAEERRRVAWWRTRSPRERAQATTSQPTA